MLPAAGANKAELSLLFMVRDLGSCPTTAARFTQMPSSLHPRTVPSSAQCAPLKYLAWLHRGTVAVATRQLLFTAAAPLYNFIVSLRFSDFFLQCKQHLVLDI